MSSALKREALRTQIDSFVFWACSARIMWCFFYEPQRLPRSYVKWIGTLAGLDSRLLEALRVIRAKEWSYLTGSPSHSHLLTTYARDLGHPAAWGDPSGPPCIRWLSSGQGLETVWTDRPIWCRRIAVPNRSRRGWLEPRIGAQLYRECWAARDKGSVGGNCDLSPRSIPPCPLEPPTRPPWNPASY
ncbi:hypothetical protein C8R46DRAFT_216928 [Mycena filopes]|nr:hypothetical protein C8R46DRAFT_216928 [Mycena filopes]